MSLPGIKPATVGFPTGHVDHLATETVVNLRLKLFQNHLDTYTRSIALTTSFS